VPYAASEVLIKAALNSALTKNIVVLLAFRLVLLYYFTPTEGLAPNALLCQDKNIDILTGKSQVLDFVVLSSLTMRYNPASERGKSQAPESPRKSPTRNLPNETA